MKAARQIGLVLGVAAAAVMALSPVPARGAGFDTIIFSGSLVGSEKAQRSSDFPEVESLVPIPPSFDPTVNQGLFLYCEGQLTNKTKGVKSAKGRFEVDLYLVDEAAGSVQKVRVGSGKFKADADGYGGFDMSLPSTLFPDDLQSGNVSAWLRSQGGYSGKKADRLAYFCGLAVTG